MVDVGMCWCRSKCICSLKSMELLGDRETAVNLLPTEEVKVGTTDFDILKVLGTGGYGKVFLVRKVGGVDDRKLYAMKVQQKGSSRDEGKISKMITERKALEALRNSEFTINMLYAFQTDSHLHLILDFVNGGDLYTHIQNGTFTEIATRLYTGELILAVQHLHRLGIIHRDIKLDNVMLDREGHVVLIDFGLCAMFSPDQEVKKAYYFCGTPEFMAPEVIINGADGYDKAVDWWGVGAVTYQLLTGSSPFHNNNFEQYNRQLIFERILNSKISRHEYLSDVSFNFLTKLLTKDPKKRLGSGPAGATDLKRHSFFKGLNWKKLAAKEIEAPFRPTNENELDLRNFSETYTSMLPVIDRGIVTVQETATFKNYSYVTPSLMPSCSEANENISDGSNNKHSHNSKNLYYEDITLKRKIEPTTKVKGSMSNGLQSLVRPLKKHR